MHIIQLKGNFVSKNIINLSKQNITFDEIYLLSKDLNFTSTCNTVDKTLLKLELEQFGRIFLLK